MQKPWFFFLLLLFMLSSCQSAQDGTSTPSSSPAAPLAISRLAQPITIGALAVAPEAYENQLLQLTGQFQSQPRLVCATDPKPFPAHWGLTADGYVAYVQGFPQVNEVAVTGLTITIEGRWRHWEGEVGCGEEVVPQEVWYLEATRILSPSPIARVTLTPTGGSAELIAGLGETAVPNATPIFTPTTTMTATAVLPTPATPETPSLPTITPAPTSTETGEIANTPEGPAETITGTITVPPGPVTGTATLATSPTPPSNNTPAPGDTPAPPTTGTPGAPPTPTIASTLVDMGETETQYLTVETLGSNEIHSWSIKLSANSVFTASVVTIVEDVILTLVSENNAVLQEANAVPGGQVETLVYNIATQGTYRIQIRTPNGRAGDYVMMINDSASYPFVLRGVLQYGSSKATFLPEEYDHFWHFLGTAGEEIRITAVPSGNEDPFIMLYDPRGEDITGFIDGGDAGEDEIFDITLTTTGIYSVRVGEIDFLEMSYTILITKSN